MSQGGGAVRPDGSEQTERPRIDGREGWRNVAVGFVSTFVVFGVAYSFGAFFEPMAEEFGAGRGATSLVFSVTAFCWFVLGPVSGHAADRFGPRPVLLTGAVAMGAGLAVTAGIDELWLGYLAYGLGVGIGVACGYVPMVAVVAGWFERRRATAIGIAVAGIGVGTQVVAPVAAALIDRHGWRSTYLGMAAASFLVLAACAAVASRPPRPSTLPRGDVAAALRSRPFLLLYVSTLLISLALFVPFVYLPPFAVALGSGPVEAAALVGLIGIASVVGRLGIAVLADRHGSVQMYRLCFAAMTLSFFVWIGAPSYPWLVGFALAFGVGYGGFIALSPAVVAHLFGVQGLGSLVGFVYTAAGVGALFGPPAAGWMIDATDSYLWALGVCIALAAGAVGALLKLPRERSSVGPAT